MRVVVVGAGSWGTAFARLLAERGHETTLACRDPEQARAIRETGRGIERLLDRIERQYTKHASRIPTVELNRFLQGLRDEREGPSRNGRRLNLLYGTQIHERPPRFRVFVNDPSLMTRDYGYWVENQLRDRFELQGVPVAIDFVRRG